MIKETDVLVFLEVFRNTLWVGLHTSTYKYKVKLSTSGRMSQAVTKLPKYLHKLYFTQF